MSNPQPYRRVGLVKLTRCNGRFLETSWAHARIRLVPNTKTRLNTTNLNALYLHDHDTNSLNQYEATDWAQFVADLV
jgi:hypothetical protein